MKLPPFVFFFGFLSGSFGDRHKTKSARCEDATAAGTILYVFSDSHGKVPHWWVETALNQDVELAAA